MGRSDQINGVLRASQFPGEDLRSGSVVLPGSHAPLKLILPVKTVPLCTEIWNSVPWVWPPGIRYITYTFL